jgi:hypothetical protein
MRKIFLSLFTGSLLFMSCSKEQTGIMEANSSNVIKNGINDRDGDGRGDDETEYCSEKTVTLIAGQNMNAGTVTVQQDATNIYVTYNTTDGWVLTQTHLFVGACNAIPVNNAGNLVPGQFPYKNTHNNVTSYTYTVPVSAIGLNNCGCIAAHAAVKKLSAGGGVISSQTAWGEGTAINPNGGNWAMKFEFCTIGCQ